MKKLILVVLFALLAAACGGSDGTTDTADSPVTTSATESDADSDNDTDDGSDSDSPADSADEAPTSDSADDAGGEAEQAPVPEPLISVPVQSRECAHTVAELGEGDTETAAEVELPPAVKPDVDDEFLGPVNELIVTDLIEGTGREAVSGATVEMEYVGVLGADGTEFDSSWDPSDAPFAFSLDTGRVIPGWDEGIQGMREGGRRVLQIPAVQAYGDQARGDIIVANSDLVFIVDLISVSPAPEPAPAIDDDLLGSFGELQVVDLVEGEGCEAISGDIVLVNYVGVDAVDGVEFDSSFSRGQTFQLTVGRGQVIDGWLEGIQGMKVGGERILQIPASLAYNEGDLVFRVHLEELIEAPLAHTVEFSGPAPTEVEIETLVEGDADGEEAGVGSIVDAHIVVMLHQSGSIAQSTYQDGSPTQLALQEGALLPGLEEGMLGLRVGETRQIIIPPAIAYPDGIPPGAIEANDALVFFVEALRILN